MNLDDLDHFKRTDAGDMLGHIDRLPDQIEAAWELGQKMELRDSFSRAETIVVCGMGGSAMGGALLAALAAPECRIPIQILRDYELPAFVAGERYLVIGSSFSGNTEETLTAFEAAAARNTQLLAITRGGRLADLARRFNASLWTFDYLSQPRAGIGYGFMLPLALLCRAAFLSDKSADVAEAAKAMREQQKLLHADVPVVNNPAKRMAGQLMDRYVAVFGSGYLAPVARRWKGQINENSKAWAQWEELPEVDHNSVVGTYHPEALIGKYMVLFLRSKFDHPKNAARHTATKELYMTQGFNTDAIEAQGESPLAQMLTCLHFGDYTSYYLAMAYSADPTPVEPIDRLKAALGRP
ncbi:MAG: bifunctional phosphoglucose/phosphomannose isomerase [Chloroflexi bacterium]|nr:bifunctional phosphoglucose/phosphomannose isomerase [Chloroflexota bacterium]